MVGHIADRFLHLVDRRGGGTVRRDAGQCLAHRDHPLFVRGYLKSRRWFEDTFALAFGYAGYKILSVKLQS